MITDNISFQLEKDSRSAEAENNNVSGVTRLSQGWKYKKELEKTDKLPHDKFILVKNSYGKSSLNFRIHHSISKGLCFLGNRLQIIGFGLESIDRAVSIGRLRRNHPDKIPSFQQQPTGAA